MSSNSVTQHARVRAILGSQQLSAADVSTAESSTVNAPSFEERDVPRLPLVSRSVLEWDLLVARAVHDL
jgi:hypothetical protein